MKKAEALEARKTEMAVTQRKLKGLSVTEGNPLPRARRKQHLLAGISQLRDFYRMSKTKDPVEVVSKPLFAANVYYNMESVMIADGARINRPEARAVIIHILSFTRKWP
jgi:hypothetical protein